jgi:hypothetical protein
LKFGGVAWNFGHASVMQGGNMGDFEWGKVYGLIDREDDGSEFVWRPERVGNTKGKRKRSPHYPGKVITIRRDCSRCAKEVKLQIGSDLVFCDGVPRLLPVPVQLVGGEVVVPVNCLVLTK